MASYLGQSYHEHPQYLRGVSCMQQKNYALAASYLTKALFIFADEPDLYVKRGEAYLLCFDINSAVANFKRATQLLQSKYGENEAAVEVMKRRLVDLLDSHGVLQFRSANAPRAYHCFSEAASFASDVPSVVFHRGLAQYAQSQLETAAGDLRFSTSSEHLRPYHWCALAVIMLKDNRFKEAKAYIERGLTGFASNLALQNVQQLFRRAFDRCQQQAKKLIESGQFEEAGRILDDLIEVLQDAELYRLRSSCLSGLGMYSAAVQDLFESISHAGGSHSQSEQQLSETLIQIADDLAVKNSGKEQALEYYTEAIKWNAAVPLWFLKRGDCSHQLGRHEHALLDYRHVLEMDSGNQPARERLAQLHDEWGVILHNKGKFEAAENEFSQAVGYNPGVALYSFHRAKCRFSLGNHTSAVDDLKKCHALGTRDPTILKYVQQHCPSLRPEPTVATVTDASGTPLFRLVTGRDLTQSELERVSRGLLPTPAAVETRRESASPTSSDISDSKKRTQQSREESKVSILRNTTRDLGKQTALDAALAKGDAGLLMPASNLQKTLFWGASAKGRFVESTTLYDPYKSALRQPHRINVPKRLTATTALQQPPPLSDSHAMSISVTSMATRNRENQDRPPPPADNSGSMNLPASPSPPTEIAELAPVKPPRRKLAPPGLSVKELRQLRSPVKQPHSA
eukprot:TRINITY_DN3731_c0_g1_i1.p1 TRINITY_DN3731_c0_g1~~TRINITY_DN3731_c0_g1_i1.p1  ORF type:complete len:685 (+),score=95.14 TRINITY_DN3731_c0_g1_i1:66-2120(+)